MTDSNPDDRLEQHERMQKSVQRDQQQRAAAIEQADPRALAGLRDEGLIETLLDPDVSTDDDEDDDLSAALKTMLSRMHVLGNITREDHEARKPLNENRAERLKAEHPPAAGIGSKCTGEFREIVVGEGMKEPLTPDRARRLEEAADVRTKMESLSVGGKAFDGVTRIQSAVYTERDEHDGDGGGSALSRARSLLPGGS